MKALGKNISTRKAKKRIGTVLSREKKNSLYLDKNGIIGYNFGCLRCPFASTPICPHGIKAGQHHSNHMCVFRMNLLKEQWQSCKSVVKLQQTDQLFKDTQIRDWMIKEWYETGELHDDYVKLSKNIISNMDKIRRQDEGIKISGEMDITHRDFRKIVDIEAKKIETGNNQEGYSEPEEKVQDSGSATA